MAAASRAAGCNPGRSRRWLCLIPSHSRPNTGCRCRHHPIRLGCRSARSRVHPGHTARRARRSAPGAGRGWGSVAGTLNAHFQPAAIALEGARAEVQLCGEKAIRHSLVRLGKGAADLKAVIPGVPQAELEVAGTGERLAAALQPALVGEGRAERCGPGRGGCWCWSA